MVSLAGVTTMFAARQKTTRQALVAEDGVQVRRKKVRYGGRPLVVQNREARPGRPFGINDAWDC
jgi:hypothetical protein